MYGSESAIIRVIRGKKENYFNPEFGKRSLRTLCHLCALCVKIRVDCGEIEKRYKLRAERVSANASLPGRLA